MAQTMQYVKLNKCVGYEKSVIDGCARNIV
jgi:hypothetical protein